MKRTHSAAALLLPVKVVVLMETLLSRLKGAAATMVHVVTMVNVVGTVVIAVLVSAMKKLVMENVLEGNLNAGVALDAEVNSNVRDLVVGIGELRMMKLHR
jgi:hypothetical protein